MTGRQTTDNLPFMEAPLQSRTGFSLLELLLATAAAAMVATGLVSALAVTVRAIRPTEAASDFQQVARAAGVLQEDLRYSRRILKSDANELVLLTRDYNEDGRADVVHYRGLAGDPNGITRQADSEVETALTPPETTLSLTYHADMFVDYLPSAAWRASARVYTQNSGAGFYYSSVIPDHHVGQLFSPARFSVPVGDSGRWRPTTVRLAALRGYYFTGGTTVLKLARADRDGHPVAPPFFEQDISVAGVSYYGEWLTFNPVNAPWLAADEHLLAWMEYESGSNFLYLAVDAASSAGFVETVASADGLQPASESRGLLSSLTAETEEPSRSRYPLRRRRLFNADFHFTSPATDRPPVHSGVILANSPVDARVAGVLSEVAGSFEWAGDGDGNGVPDWDLIPAGSSGNLNEDGGWLCESQEAVLREPGMLTGVVDCTCRFSLLPGETSLLQMSAGIPTPAAEGYLLTGKVTLQYDGDNTLMVAVGDGSDGASSLHDLIQVSPEASDVLRVVFLTDQQEFAVFVGQRWLGSWTLLNQTVGSEGPYFRVGSEDGRVVIHEIELMEWPVPSSGLPSGRHRIRTAAGEVLP